MVFTVLDTVCWGGFAAVWAVGAIYNSFKAPSADKVPRDWYRGWAVGVLAIWLPLRFVPPTVWRALTMHGAWLAAAGSLVLVAGTALIMWARYVLGRMWSSAPMLKDGHALRVTGPYAITRHPIYTGLLTMILGMALEHGFGIFLPALVGFVLLIQFKLRLEERLMLERFGDEYRDYSNAVPQLIPGLKFR